MWIGFFNNSGCWEWQNLCWNYSTRKLVCGFLELLASHALDYELLWRTVIVIASFLTPCRFLFFFFNAILHTVVAWLRLITSLWSFKFQILLLHWLWFEKQIKCIYCSCKVFLGFFELNRYEVHIPMILLPSLVSRVIQVHVILYVSATDPRLYTLGSWRR